MSLELVEDALDLPALAVQRSQLQRGGRVGIEDVGDEPAAVLRRRGRILQRVVDHAHGLSGCPGAVGAVEEGAEVRAVAVRD